MLLTRPATSLRYPERFLGRFLRLGVDVHAQDPRFERPQQRPGDQGCSFHRWELRLSDILRQALNTTLAGGWGGSTYFSQTMSTSANRTTFVNACVSAVNTYSLDGMSADRNLCMTLP